MYKWLLSILFFASIINASGQLGTLNLNYQERINAVTIYSNDAKSNHSSVLPIITFIPATEKSALEIRTDTAKMFRTRLYPITNLGVGYELSTTNTNRPLFEFGIGAGINISSKKLFFSAQLLPYTAQTAYLRDSIKATTKLDPSVGRALNDNLFLQNEVILGYRPNRFFTFLAGNGRNFFGEGYRSLILSDNAGSNPFLKIETSFSNVKYVNLFQMWGDNTIDPLNKELDRKKFAAMHYISWNITREFNISIFETVIWQLNDTLVNRGFDPNYLNPIVFYRPVEYGNGSADNVLLGANMSYKFNKNHSLYTQIILDDFLLSEIRARSRWWANKYGFQLGYKSKNFLGTDDLYFQTEFNLVRPFTYSHKTSTQSYGHLNQSVAHPIGANFYEILNIVSYKKGEFRFTNQLTYTGYGADSSATSYGQNVFVPYGQRDGEYDHFIMQGVKKNVLNETIMIETPIVKNSDIYLNFTYNLRIEKSASQTMTNQYFTIGVRSRIWNRYTDF